MCQMTRCVNVNGIRQGGAGKRMERKWGIGSGKTRKKGERRKVATGPSLFPKKKKKKLFPQRN